MPREYQRKLGARRYADYSKDHLQNCLDSIRSGQLTQRQAEERFKIPRRTIINKLKGDGNRPGFPQIFSDEEESHFVKCILQFSDYGFPLNQFDLRIVVKTYLTRTGRSVKRFKNNIPGIEWVRSFLKRHPELTTRFAANIKRVRASVNAEVLQDYISALGETVEGVPPENIWNFDESNLTDNPGQKKVIVKRGTKYPEKIINSSKSSISLMFSGSATGEFLPPYVVYKAAHLWNTWTENGPAGCRYSVTPSGWFESNTFEDWFESILLPRLKKLEGKKVVICDNLSSHLSVRILKLCQENNVSFVCIPANSTHITQPLDVTFFRPMKEAWRKILLDYKETAWGCRSSSLEKQYFPSLLKKLMEAIEPNQKTNLIAGFKKCGIYPLDVAPLLDRMPKSSVTPTTDIDASFLETLHAKRNDLTQPKISKRKKLDITPGKSVAVEDLSSQPKPSTSENADKTNKINSGFTRKKVQQNRNVVKGLKLKKKPLFAMCEDEDEDVDGDLKEYVIEVEKEANKDKEAEKNLELLNSGKKTFEDLLSLDEVKKEIGEYVIFTYEGEYFPGKIISLYEDGAEISAMQRSLKSWKWPDKPDIHKYDWEDVIGHCKEPKLVSKRGFFNVPELGVVWDII